MTLLNFNMPKNSAAATLLIILTTTISSFGMKSPSPISLRMGVIGKNDTNIMRQVVVYFDRLTDALPKNSIVFELSFQHSNLLLIEATQSRLDGLGFRSAQTNRLPGLETFIKVPTPMTYIHLVVYSMDSTLPCITKLKDLPTTTGFFGVHKGHVFADYVIDSLKLSDRRIYVDSNPQALNLMKTGRIRYYIQTYEVFETFLRATPHDTKVYFQGEIASEGVHLFLAPKFKSVVSILNAGILKVNNSPEGILDILSQEPLHNSKNCRVDLW